LELKKSIVAYLRKLGESNTDLFSAAQYLSLALELNEDEENTIDLVQFFYESLENIPEVSKSTPFDDYLKVLQEKGYFNGTTVGDTQYNERLEKARDKWESNAEKKKQSAIQLKDQGNDLFKNGDYDGSIDLYTQAIQADSTNPSYFSNRGLAYSKVKRYEQAVQDYNTSLSLDDTQVKIYVRLGNTLTQLGRQEEAIETYRRGLIVDPSNEDLLNNIDIILRESAQQVQLQQQQPGEEGGAPTGMPNFDFEQFMTNPAIAGNMEQMSNIMNNPEFVSMAQNLMQDPNFQTLMSGMFNPGQFQ